MLTKSEQERFAEDGMWAAYVDDLEARCDLLASRLCAIAFEAGMSGERPRACWDPDTTDDGLYEVRRVGLAFSLEEVK